MISCDMNTNKNTPPPKFFRAPHNVSYNHIQNFHHSAPSCQHTKYKMYLTCEEITKEKRCHMNMKRKVISRYVEF